MSRMVSHPSGIYGTRTYLFLCFLTCSNIKVSRRDPLLLQIRIFEKDRKKDFKVGNYYKLKALMNICLQFSYLRKKQTYKGMNVHTKGISSGVDTMSATGWSIVGVIVNPQHYDSERLGWDLNDLKSEVESE